MASTTTTTRKLLLPLKIRLQLALTSLAFDICRSKNSVYRRLFNLLDTQASPLSTPQLTSSHISLHSSFTSHLFNPTQNHNHNQNQTLLPVIFFIHGGGFSFLSATSKPYHNLCSQLAIQTPAIILSLNYRLAPEHTFPTQYDDVERQLKLVDSQHHTLLPSNADVSRCFIAGDSAGANIAHHVLLRLLKKQLKSLNFIGTVMIQPFFGGEERTEAELRLTRVPYLNLERTDWAWRAFLPEGCNRNHEAVNVFGNSEMQEVWPGNFPKTVVFIGGFDPLQDWQRRYFEGLKLEERCGEDGVRLIEYENAIHAFYGFPDLPEFGFLIRDVKKFVHDQLSP